MLPPWLRAGLTPVLPQMIRWLGKVEPNSVNTKIMSSLDWFPTIAALAGFALQPAITYDGLDVTAAMFTDAASPRTTFFFHSVSNTLCNNVVVESSDDDDEIRAARGEIFDAASHWPQESDKSTAAATTTCKYTMNTGIASPTVGPVIKNVSSQQACCQLCLANKRCTASAWHSPGYNGDKTSLLDCYLHSGRTHASPVNRNSSGIIACDTGRPPSPPPPPQSCMPLVMAVRHGKYKLHMFTKGGGRPPTGRDDWPPKAVQGLQFG